MKNLRPVAIGAALGAAILLLAPRPAHATFEIQKAAKAAGFAEVTSCVYCHVEKLPKKGAVSHNDRGKWLLAEKAKRKAEKIDVNWLKEYQPPTPK